MMIKTVKHFAFALLCILSMQLIFAHVCFAETASLQPDSAGLFSNDILTEMHRFMLKTYQSLCQVLMIGHALMCYAIYVDYTTILDVVELPNINFFLVGLIIYGIGVFMAMSVGMYFVDVCFKLGFAILFMPVSIALWPFPPTKRKFADNLSIIIRNSMLFMLVAIGVSYSVKLISEGLISDGDNFWDAIKEAESEKLTDSFSFFSTHIVVVIFCLAYGLKILEGSVNNYLNAFFFDAMFGSESPMHKMGTQAVGTLAEYTAKPAMDWAKDVASHQTGRALAAAGGGMQTLGKGLEKMGSAEGRQELKEKAINGITRIKTNTFKAAKQAAHAASNPRETYNNAMSAAAQKVNKGILKAGDIAKDVVDNATLFAPIPMRESWREALLEKINGVKDEDGNYVKGGLIDKVTNKAGNAAEKAIAHGGGTLRKAVTNPRDTYNQVMDAAGAGANNAVHLAGDAVEKVYRAGVDIGVKLGKDDDWRRSKLKPFNAKVDAAADIVGGVAEYALADSGRDIKNVAKAASAPIVRAAQPAVNAVKDAVEPGVKKVQAVAQGVSQTAQIVASGATGMAKAAATKVNDVADNVSDKFSKAYKSAARSVKDTLQKANEEADKAPISLAPSKLISAPFKAVAHPVDAIGKLADNYEKIQGLPDEQRKIVLKQKAGQIVLRTLKDTGKDIKTAAKVSGKVAKPVAEVTAKGAGKTVGFLGKMLQKFGNNMADNSDHKGKYASLGDIWDYKNGKAIEAAAKQAEDAEYFREMDGGE